MPTETEPLSGVIAETDQYRVRSLTPEEFTTRAQDLLHYATIPDPTYAAILVVEDKATGEVVASWMAITSVFLEGLYIAPNERGTQIAVQRLLLGGMFSLLASHNVAHPLTLAQDPAILALARKAGFVPIAGTLLKLE